MIELYCNNCLEQMKNIKNNSINCIICDLPYGTTKCEWDIIIPFEPLWQEYHRIIKPSGSIILFGQEPFSTLIRSSNLKEYKYDIYWEKERLTNVNQVKKRVGKTIETISVFYNKQCTYNPQMVVYDGPKRSNKVKDGKLGKLTDAQEKKVIEYKDNGLRYPTQVWHFKRDILTCNLHPTQKPLELLEALVRTFTNEDDTILDNCMGAGTTGVACKKLHRNFIGIEKEEKYYQIAKERIEAAEEIDKEKIQNILY